MCVIRVTYRAYSMHDVYYSIVVYIVLCVLLFVCCLFVTHTKQYTYVYKRIPRHCIHWKWCCAIACVRWRRWIVASNASKWIFRITHPIYTVYIQQYMVYTAIHCIHCFYCRAKCLFLSDDDISEPLESQRDRANAEIIQQTNITQRRRLYAETWLVRAVCPKGASRWVLKLRWVTQGNSCVLFLIEKITTKQRKLHDAID